MMLLLDFAEARVNRSGGKKNHGNHSNNNTDREYLSVSNTSRSVIINVVFQVPTPWSEDFDLWHLTKLNILKVQSN